MTLFALLFAIGLPGGAGERPPLISPIERISVTPVHIEAAFSAFRALCMDGFPDPAAVARRALASPLGFQPTGPGAWRSSHGELRMEVAAGGQATCDLRIAVSDRLEERALADLVGRKLASGRRRLELGGPVAWDLGRDFSERLTYSPASSDPRYFSLVRSRGPALRVK